MEMFVNMLISGSALWWLILNDMQKADIISQRKTSGSYGMQGQGLGVDHLLKDLAVAWQ